MADITEPSEHVLALPDGERLRLALYFDSVQKRLCIQSAVLIRRDGTEIPAEAVAAEVRRAG